MCFIKFQGEDSDDFLSVTDSLYISVNSRKDKRKELKVHILKDFIAPRGFEARIAEIPKKVSARICTASMWRGCMSSLKRRKNMAFFYKKYTQNTVAKILCILTFIKNWNFTAPVVLLYVTNVYFRCLRRFWKHPCYSFYELAKIFIKKASEL